MNNIEHDLMVAIADQRRRAHYDEMPFQQAESWVDQADQADAIVLKDQHARTARWFQTVRLARLDRQQRVWKHGQSGTFSLSAIAQESGIAPHSDNDSACRQAGERNRRAASLIRWESAHRSTVATSQTAWSVAR